MKLIKAFLIITLFGLSVYAVTASAAYYYGDIVEVEDMFGAPNQSIRYERSMIPETDSTYELGTSSKAWLRINADEICLTADSCETTWSAGGGGDFAWTPGTNYGEDVVSTSTPIWLQDTLYASSTSFFTGTTTIDTLLTPYENTVTVAKSGGDYYTIQDALDDNPISNLAVLVYPGTYTNDTINFTANAQVVKNAGRPNVTKITNSAQIIEAGDYIGVAIIDMRIDCSPTTDVNCIEVNDGNLTIIQSRLALTTDTDLYGVSPELLAVTGTGAFKSKMGEFYYTNTASTTNAIKSISSVASGGILKILRPCVINMTTASSALAVSLVIDAGTGEFFIEDACEVIIDDDGASIVAGFGYIGGSGNEKIQNSDIKITGTGVNCYGVYNGGTGTFRSENNIYEVTGCTNNYSFLTGASAETDSHFDDIRAVNGSTGAGSLDLVASESDGDFTISGHSTLATASTTQLTNSGLSWFTGLLNFGNATGTGVTATNFWGALIGNADTATKLAANGANCAAGSYPLGVDDSGAVEDCTDATTEIDTAISTHAGDDDAHHALVTLAGQNYLTLSTQQITAGEIEPDDLAGSDFGDFTCDGDTCSLDTAYATAFSDIAGLNSFFSGETVASTSATFSGATFDDDSNTLSNIDGENIKDNTIDVDSLDWGAFTDLGESGVVTWSNLASGELTSEVLIIGTDVKAGTLTDTKLCTWDNDNTQIVCDTASAAFDSTAVDATTWSDGANASNIWTFDVSGTDHTMTFGNGLITLSHALTVTGTITGDVTGALTGNADTATALAANGGNCAAGSYPLGVDDSGAIEDCTDATTEINTEIGNVLDGTDAFTDFNGADIIDSDNYNTDSVDNEHINWADIDYLVNEGAGVNEAYAAGWDADVGCPEKDDVYDYFHAFDADDDSSFTDESWYTNLIDGTAVFTDLNGDNIIDSDNYNAGSIDLEHMASQSVDSDNIVEATIVEADLNADEAPADNDILTFDTTGDNFSWQTPAELSLDAVTTAGDYITRNTNDFDVDAEAVTEQITIYIEDPVATDDLQSLWHNDSGKDFTIEEITCESDQADGVQLDLQIDDGTPADVNGTDLDCDNTPANDASMGGDAVLADGESLDLVITSVGGSETWLSIHVKGKYSD